MSDFRYCVYCGADCHDDEPAHAEDCPTVTGVWPVRVSDVTCPGCKTTYVGMRCCECREEFRIGDHYVHREIDPGDPLIPGIEGASVVEIVCLGCAATIELGAAS